MNRQKIIGTLVPLNALFSAQLPKEDRGTFATGTIFLHWLKKTNQSAWQMLPLHQTQLEMGSSHKHVPSPYKSYGIGLSPDYLSSSFAGITPSKKEKAAFVAAQNEWIMDYALFCSLRDHFGTDDWRMWDKDVQSRKETSLLAWTEKLKNNIDYHITIQWQLHKSYADMRTKAKKLGIMLIGDLPFYLSIQSPLVWAHQNLFLMQKDGTMPYVSGVPDTPAAHFGRQVWGHPLYKWKSREKWKKISALWEMRLLYLSTLFDLIRFDHAKAFFEYGAIDPENENNDHYKKGPGIKIFEELISYSHKNSLHIYAEDSGEHVQMLRKSLQKLQIPGIKILRFALDEKKGKVNKHYVAIADYPKDTIAYTTTHDTQTLVGYLHVLKEEQKQTLAAAAQIVYVKDNREYARRLRNAVLASPARIAIIPIQDWLLTTDRINIPGTEKPVNDTNWNFQLKVPIEELPTIF